MHGLLLYGLQRFVTETLGEDTWWDLLHRAGLQTRIYGPAMDYPDDELRALVGAAAEATGTPAPDLLEAYGAYLAPILLHVYAVLVQKEWTALDLLEHTEETIHRVVRLKNPRAQPPRLRCRRRSADELLIVYDSPRRLCAVARGLVRGVGKRYREALEIAEPRCMHRGDAACEIVVRRRAA